MVHRYNGQMGEKRLSYTFDAGPNAVLITTQKWLDEVCALVEDNFMPEEMTPDNWYMSSSVPHYPIEGEVPKLDNFVGPKSGVKFCILTQIGRGPYIIEEHFSSYINT